MYTKSLFVFICMVLCWVDLCLCAGSERIVTEAADLAEFKPSWTVGQTWYVEVETLTERPGKPDVQDFVPRRVVYGYRFDVETQCRVEEEQCCQIRVQIVSVNGKEIQHGPLDYWNFYRLFFRIDDGSLKMLQRFRGVGDEIPLLFSLSYPREPVMGSQSTGSLPIVSPVFSSQAYKYAPNDSTDPNGPGVARPLEIRQKQESSKEAWVANGTEKAAMDISLVCDHGPQVGVETSKQVWTKGLPWPLLTEYTRGRQPARTARLVSVDGSPVAIMRRQSHAQDDADNGTVDEATER